MGVAPDGSGCVLVAEMSTAGTLATGEYSKCEMKIKLLYSSISIVLLSQLL